MIGNGNDGNEKKEQSWLLSLVVDKLLECFLGQWGDSTRTS